MTDAELGAATNQVLKEMRSHFDRGDVDGAMEFGAAMLYRLVNADRSFVCLLSDDMHSMTVAYAAGQGVTRDFLGHVFERSKLPPITEQALRSGQQVVVEDAKRAHDVLHRTTTVSGVNATIITRSTQARTSAAPSSSTRIARVIGPSPRSRRAAASRRR